MEGISPTEVMALTKDNDGLGNSWFGMIIVLFFLVYGMNGTWGGGNRFDNAIGYENLATSNEVQRGFDNQNSMANQRDILAAVNNVGAQGIAATNQTFHDMLGVFTDKYSELQRDIAGLAVGQQNLMNKQSECCCGILRAIDGVNYNIALQGASLEKAIMAEGSATRELIQGNRMADMQNQINRLEMSQQLNPIEQRLSMMPTYPNGFYYNAGPSPFCTCNANGCCNI